MGTTVTLLFGGDQLASPPGDFPDGKIPGVEREERQMRFLSWRVERGSSPNTDQTRVRIEIVRNPDVYVYKWVVAHSPSRRLSKRELHALEMKVAKYVAILNETAPEVPEHKTIFATL
jgi:hypothetical protein